jgi:hypothetical protein
MRSPSLAKSHYSGDDSRDKTQMAYRVWIGGGTKAIVLVDFLLVFPRRETRAAEGR